MRSALGASRSRVVAQLFAETLLLALVATGLGLLLLDWLAARWATPTLAAVGLPFWVDLGVTTKTAMTALFLGVFCAVVAGVLPALKATRGDIRGTMRGAVVGGAGIRFGGGSGALVVAMVTLTVSCLLIGAAVSPSFLQVKGGMIGFDASHYLSGALAFPWAPPYTNEERTQGNLVKQALIDRLESEPGVLGVAFGSNLPGIGGIPRLIEIEGGGVRDGSVGQRASSTYVDLGFFRGLGYELVSGRDFDADDIADDRSAVIVNTAFVERIMGGRSAVGRRFRYPPPPNRQSEASRWYEIVGVVGHQGMLDSNAEREGVYHPIAASQLAGFRFAVHLGPDPTSLVPRLREILMDIDPSAMILNPIALNEVFSDEDFLYQAGALGLVFMVVLSGFLGIAGVYALLSLSVARRTREIGVRRAVGAQSASIALTVAKRALLQLGVGVSIGSLLGGAILSEMKKDPSIDFASWPILLGLFGVGVIVIGLLSCAVPTVRGLRISVLDALRVDG